MSSNQMRSNHAIDRSSGGTPSRRRRSLRTLAGAIALMACGAALIAQSPGLPHLRTQGTATQLVVEGRPFLIRGGELGNSSSDLDHLAPHWAGFRALHLNTIVAPVYWDRLEPDQGQFHLPWWTV